MNETELLFTDLLGCDRFHLYLNKDTVLSRKQGYMLSRALKRRIRQEPIQYILGNAYFFGLKFTVNKNVFIPRAETEILVEALLKMDDGLWGMGDRLWGMGDGLRVLDIATGSGCIAISLAKFLPIAEIDATDVSMEALKIAEGNAKLNNVKVNFMQGDLFNVRFRQPITYDLITCNPPYVPSYDIEGLPGEVAYEPRLALDGGRDGLDFYRRLIRESPPYLKTGGFLIMEIGFGQRAQIEGIFQHSKFFRIQAVIKDYNNIDRVIIARKSQQSGNSQECPG